MTGTTRGGVVGERNPTRRRAAGFLHLQPTAEASALGEQEETEVVAGGSRATSESGVRSQAAWFRSVPEAAVTGFCVGLAEAAATD